MKLPSEKKLSKLIGSVHSLGKVKKDGVTYSLDLGSCVENETMRTVFSDQDKKLKIAPSFQLQVNVRRVVELDDESKESSKFDILEIPGGSRAYAPRKQPDNLQVRFTPPGASLSSIKPTQQKREQPSESPRKEKKSKSDKESKSPKKKKKSA